MSETPHTRRELKDFLRVNGKLVDHLWIREGLGGYELGYELERGARGVLCKQRRTDRDSGPRVFKSLDACVDEAKVLVARPAKIMLEIWPSQTI